jgi:protein tyrosine phosphatase (PTP) superfamily phosphohydrolase (DUF442 family)
MRRTLGVLLTVLAAQAVEPATAAAGRDPTWARPVAVAGAANLHQVAAGVYRCAQPDAKALAAMQQALGLRTVLNLRHHHDDQDEAKGLPLTLVAVPLDAWEADEPALVRAVVALMDPARRPILVHCQHGADRTGLVVALYRVAAEGWTREAAAAEMIDGGFGFHAMWRDIAAYIRNLDEARFRRLVAEARQSK